MRLQFSRLDALLLLMTIIWGSNYSVIKSAFAEIPPIAFNALRLLLASLLFLAAIAASEGRQHAGPSFDRRDWIGVVALGVVGQFIYQLLFMSGLAQTSVANSSLILGCTPILVALMAAAAGQERIGAGGWAGAALSALGIYFVVGHGAAVTRESFFGDLKMFAAVVCWSASTVGARPLLARHSALVVTGYSMAIGAALYLPFAGAELSGLEWRRVSAAAWLSLAFSAIFALNVAYMIWYTAVQRLGNTRTSVYSNMVPLAAMAVAWLWLGEPISAVKIAGAAAILAGVALTKLHAGPPGVEPA